MRGKALKEAQRIHDELEQIDTIASHVKRDWDEFVRTADDACLKAVAYDLQGFYTGLERILQSIADTIDDHLPAGESWHKASTPRGGGIGLSPEGIGLLATSRLTAHSTLSHS